MAAVAPIARHGQVGESGAARTGEAAQPSPSGPSDRRAVALAASVAVGARWPHLVGDWRLWAILAGSTFLWSRVSARQVVGFVVVAAVAFAVAANLADRANEGLQWRRSTAYVGWATVARDPDPTPFGGRVELRIAHRHVLAAGNGPPGWALLRLSAGERVSVSGTVQVLRPVPGWLRARHIGARLNVRAVLGRRIASQPWRSVNALRRVLLDGGRVLPKRQQPLYGGFILGDDRGQRPEITDDFRGSGLSHLLVVSGQNVAFLFIAARDRKSTRLNSSHG